MDARKPIVDGLRPEILSKNLMGSKSLLKVKGIRGYSKSVTSTLDGVIAGKCASNAEERVTGSVDES